MKMDHNPPPSIKQAMLLSAAGLFPFSTNPPFHLGRNARGVRSFWVRDAQGKVAEVSGEAWTKRFPPSLKPQIGVGKTALKKDLAHVGGRIVIGLSGVEGEQDLARIEAYVPDLITEVLAGALQDVGWTIGRFGYGRYVDEKGKVFDERSTVVQIAGIDSETLGKIALELATYLGQTSVLVFDDNERSVSFIGPDKPEEAKP